MKDSILELKLMDEYSDYDSPVHNMHPVSIFVVTIAAIITTLTFSNYEVIGIIPMILYPVFIFELSGLPKKVLLKRMLLGLVFVMGVGIFNPILDRTVLISIKGVGLTAGWLSFISLLLKGAITLVSVMLMVASLGMLKLVKVLYVVKVPKVFVLQLILTFRYVSVLLEEISNTYNAYCLRSEGQNGIHFTVWGSYLGHILLRTFDRAEKIYDAMLLRGFEGEYTLGEMDGFKFKDFMFVVCWITFFVVIRVISIPHLIGLLVTGG